MMIEVYSYLRSPYRDLFVYDSVVQVRVGVPYSILLFLALSSRLPHTYDIVMLTHSAHSMTNHMLPQKESRDATEIDGDSRTGEWRGAERMSER